MTNEELDILWFKAMRQSVEEDKAFIRYHFAALVAAEKDKDIERLREENVYLKEVYKEVYDDLLRYRKELFDRLGKAVAAEREACELTVDSLIISGPVSEVQQRHNWAYMHARDAIRARGEQEHQR